jgi:sugar/nucleoside kinase (ribokinase family)
MTRILTSDLLIADIIAPVEGHPALLALVEKYALQPGSKVTLDDEQLKEFMNVFRDVPHVMAAGGSSANMLTTLAKLMPKEIEVRFIGVAGESKYSDIVRDSLHEAGIVLLPEHIPTYDIRAMPGLSYVLVFPDGQCTIATHPGNARDILKPAVVAEHTVKNCEVLLVQGSVWHKFHDEYADRLYHLCQKHKRHLWLTLPTQKELNLRESEKMAEVLPHASLVLGNEAELSRLFKKPLTEAMSSLQKILRGSARLSGANGSEPLGFITLGDKGAAVIRTDDIEYIAPVDMASDQIANTIGAGDTAYAGFAAGYLKGLSDTTAAGIAMTLASAKLRTNGPRLADPLVTLAETAPDLADRLRAA